MTKPSQNPSTAGASGGRRVELVGLALVLAVSQLHAAWFGHICDDAYISFRYAYNLAHGAGLTFNPGERVMGYSNLLWVLALAAFERVGISSVTAAVGLGSMCSLVLLVVLFFHLRTSCRSRWPAFAAVLFLASNSTFALWTVCGLEGPLFGLLLILGALAAARGALVGTWRLQILAGVPFALAVLTRPEGLMFAIAAALTILLRYRDRPPWRAAGLLLLAPAVAWAGETLWMLAYYGDALPNTYHAKVHALSWPLLARGTRLAWYFVTAYSFVPPAVVALWLGWGRRAEGAVGWLAFALLAAFVWFFISVGGDQLVYYRMWFWIIPLLAILLAQVLDALLAHRNRWPRTAAFGLAAGATIASAIPSFVGGDWQYLREDDALIKDIDLITEQLRQLPPDTLLAANTVGSLTYGSRLRMVDMLGLNDRHIARAPGKVIGIAAHESHDGAYVLARQPDLIFLGMPRLFARPLSLAQALSNSGYPSDLDLLGSSIFRDTYLVANLSVRDGRYCPSFVRRSSAARLGLAPSRL